LFYIKAKRPSKFYFVFNLFTYRKHLQMAMNSSKFLKRLFRKINGVVWDVVSGGVGLQTENGIFTVSFSDTGAASLNCNPLDDFGLAIPAFATQVAIADVEQGDIVVGDQGIIGWVTDKTDAAVKVIDHSGYSKTYSPPKVSVFGGVPGGILVVRNLMSLTGGAAGASNFASSLMPLLMLGGGDDKLEKLLPLLLMTSQAAPAVAGAPAANPMANMLPLLLMSGGLGGEGKKGDLDPMMLMALSGGLGGGAGGMNPMMLMALMGKGGDLFGSSEKVPALTPVTRGGVPVLNRL
jgi:hypothetical protein